MDSNSQRRWDDSLLSKEEGNALFLSKKEAVMKRERIKEYTFGQRVRVPSIKLFRLVLFSGVDSLTGSVFIGEEKCP